MNGKISILIVDDNKAARDSLDMLLGSEGYDLYFAEDGLQAIELAKKHHPDLVLLDIMMPGMDGYEVCRSIRLEAGIREVPIILITALDDRDSKLRGIRAGADDFISKPFDRAELRLKIRNITTLNRYRSITNARGRFEWLAEMSDDAAVIVGGNDVILYCNEAARIYFSIPEDFENSTIRFLNTARRNFITEPAHLWAGWPDNLDDANGEARYLIRPETEQMKSLWLEVSVLEQHDEDNVFVVTMKNITKHVQNWRDGQLLHNALSHKLRSPLMNIIGGFDLLTEKYSNVVPDEIPVLSSLTTEGISELKEAITDILRYTDARAVLLREPKCTIARLVELAGESAHAFGLDSLLVTCDEVVKQVILNISEDAVNQIIQELIENSQKFHPGNAAVVRLSIEVTDENQVRITFSDNGISIPPEEIRRVWEPYYQAEPALNAATHGLGLGLAYVRSLILSVGGACNVDNLENGNGISVTLFIPYI